MPVFSTEHELIQPTSPDDSGRARARRRRARGMSPVGLACLAALLPGCHKQPAEAVHHPGDSAETAAGQAGDQEHAAGHGARWSYEGDTGPASWGAITTEYATCGQGRSQSPVDLPASVPASAGHHIAFHYRGFAQRKIASRRQDIPFDSAVDLQPPPQ